jgi:putrescine transport system permease protein
MTPAMISGAAGRRQRRGAWLLILPPMLFLSVFFLLPFAFALKISLADAAIAIPPFTRLLATTPDGHIAITLNLDNYRILGSDPLYILSYATSLRTAALSTLLCLLIAYPMAYAIACCRRVTQTALLLLVVLPFWTSFLLRVYALENIIGEYGLVQKCLAFLGLTHGPMHLMHSQAAVYIGIVYSYLPYMILPLYAMLEKMDPSLLEAAADLGARPIQRFLDVTLPLSVPGILAGSMLVLIPAIGEFVIPSLLGGPNSLMIGRVLWDEFFANHDWPVASAVATAFLVLVAGPIALYQHLQMREQAA